METKSKKKTYTKEFKIQAVERCKAEGLKKTSEELGVSAASLSNWRKLHPSRLGKNFVAKLSLYSCIWYYTQSMEVPDPFAKSLKTMVNSFIWSTRKKEIDESSRSLTQLTKMCQTPKKGGCNFLDLQSEIDAFATRWIQRLLDPSEALWKDFVWHKIEELIEDPPS